MLLSHCSSVSVFDTVVKVHTLIGVISVVYIIMLLAVIFYCLQRYYRTYIPKCQLWQYLQYLEISMKEALQNFKKSQAYQAKFTQAMAHEIQTPLTIIRGHIETNPHLQFPALIPAIERIVRCMNSAVFFSSLDIEQPSIRNTLSLAKLIQDSLENHQYYIDQKHITLHQHIAADITLIGNPITLELAFSNIISNAIKYIGTGKKCITITARQSIHYIYISIKDTGKGMDEHTQAQLFDPFSKKGDSSGFGIGLSLVKKIVDHHDGSISVESILHKGTTVTLQFAR